MQERIAKRLGLASIILALAPAVALAQAPGERSAVRAVDCDYACLIGFARSYMDALAHRDPARVKFSKDVRFTENNVEMAVGKQGLWATVSGVASAGLEAADISTGEAAWIGTAEEHGLPVYYGMRLKVRERAISAVETIVVRTTGLPLPFGDVKKIVHDPAFTEILPPEQRRSRERLRAVADSYFNTVELNDGMVFAPFTDDCARLENGILTTAAGPGSAGAISPGCEAQFKLGIYRINKRIRERRYPLIDVERGVVVATAFFDHANEFDSYKTTDGVVRKTALKWPNSISLVEAFKITDGRIRRIEAVFTYVPYFMHSPFYEYPPLPAMAKAKSGPEQACDKDCLIGLADSYMDALVTQRPDSLPWADEVRFTENGVGLQVGEGFWGSARSKAPGALRVADAATGNVVWYGVVSDHDLPAYYGMRMKVKNKRIAEVESFVARARNPGPFSDAAKFSIDAGYERALVSNERQSRKRMIATVEAYVRSLEEGKVTARFAPACARIENGAAVTEGQSAPAVVAKDAAIEARGCEAQLKLGLYKPLDDVRGLRIAAVDEDRGLVVATSLVDFGLSETRYITTDGKQRETQYKYPSTREMFEVYKMRNGMIERIDAVSVFQPYLMPLAWE